MRGKKKVITTEQFKALLHEIDGIKSRGEIEDSIIRAGLSKTPTFAFFIKNEIIQKTTMWGMWRCNSVILDFAKLRNKYYEKSCI